MRARAEKDRPMSRLVAGMFTIVRGMRGQPCAEVEEELLALRPVLLALDERWVL